MFSGDFCLGVLGVDLGDPQPPEQWEDQVLLAGEARLLQGLAQHALLLAATLELSLEELLGDGAAREQRASDLELVRGDVWHRLPRVSFRV